MERREEVENAINRINQHYSDEFYDGHDWDVVYHYIHSLEMMVDAAYSALNELDELV